MTRLSDLLRGAADRAPIGEASVSLEGAHRKIRFQRGARGAANGLLGAGAVALLVVGIVRPALTPGKDGADSMSSAPSGGLTDSARPSVESDFWYDEWGSCGSYLDAGYPETDDAIALTVDAGDWVDLRSGSTLDVPVRLETSEDVSIKTFGAEAVLLWQGMVVARLDSSQAEEVLDLAVGGSVDTTLQFPLVNCFDGTALPAAKYELVVSQGYSLQLDGIEPTPESSVDAPDALTDEPMPPVEPGWEYREISPAVTVSIAGEVVDNPFADYLWTPPAKPDDLITPERARELYEAALVSGVWDMAPGTSRWIIPNYNKDLYNNEEVSATIIAPTGWFGCSWDGTTGITFPSESADLDLLRVSVTFPSRINLSYGWVVDGNPVVRFSVENTSDYSLPGFYGEPSHSLYLVKDGRVVAEAWPQNVRPYSQGAAYDVDSAVSPDQYWGTLAPGASLTGDYLWRDLNGCWTDTGPRPVASGTYTLVTAQTVYIENSSGDGHPVLYRDSAAAEEKATSSADVPAIEPGIAPVDPYYTYDWVEFQVWTSLGTVTITTS